MAKNVLGNSLISCSKNPLTCFFRNGKCDTCSDDIGMHTVCALMTDDFLKFSYENGNDLCQYDIPVVENKPKCDFQQIYNFLFYFSI